MTNKPIRIFADGIGELRFDGERAVASRLDVGCPSVRRIVSKSASALGERTEDVVLGGGELIFEGYFLDRSNGGGASALRAKLCSIAAPGREFSLAVGERERRLFAKELTFASEPPFATGLAEKFRLAAFSDDPYFHAGERSFFGEAKADQPIALPAALPAATGVSRCVGEIRIENDGDETCGIVIEVDFTSAAGEFHMTSDRESGRFYTGRTFDAGDLLVIDTTPGQRSICDGDGESLLSTIGASCAFFLAPPGVTRLTWNSYSATPPKIAAKITPGYLGVTGGAL